MNRCYQCFQEYEAQYEVCPFCGNIIGASVTEPRYLSPGTFLQNRYIVGTVIGAGGFGITYLAWDKMLEQKVAIKEYLPGEFSTRGREQIQVTIYGGEKAEQFKMGREKFQDESKRLAKFQNIPGIVQIYSSFTENNTVYIVMEYLEGETLDKMLKREGKLSEQKAIEIMLPILQALEVVHKEGILHRDIAPNNIFITKGGEVKLLDFGAARSATGSHSKSLTVLYKEGYTPEEQYRSRGDQGPWTDVYACAATMYRMVTGKIPSGALERRRKDTLKEPSKNGAKTSKEVDIALLNALNVDVKYRTQSAGQFLKELTGEVKGKKHFIRTIEKKVGKMPLSIKVCTSMMALLIVAFLGLLFTGVIKFDVESFSNLFVEEGKARVVNVVNMEQDAAEKKLEKVGLILEIEDIRYSNKIREGRIISQAEEKGEIVKEGTPIHVIVSKGAGIVEMPDMIGKKWDSMQLQLDELCLEYEVERVISMEAPGYVCKQSVEAGTELEQGESVFITVSEGNNYDVSKQNEAEDLIGKVYEEAKVQLADIGVYLQVLEYKYDDVLEKGTIVNQKIKAGTLINGGEVQEVTVSAGLEPKEVPNLIGLTEQEAKELLEAQVLSANVNIVINKEKEEGTVIAQSIKAGESVDKFSEINIDICSHGVDVPSLIGLSYEQAVKITSEKGLNLSATYVFGGDGTISSQSPQANSVVDEGSNIAVNVGMSQTEFTNQLVANINVQRRAAGMGEVTLSSAWTQAASTLAASGKTSTDARDSGFDYGYALPQRTRSGSTFWATREWITTVDNMMTRLPMTSEAFLDPNKRVIGIGYSGSRISILVSPG